MILYNVGQAFSSSTIYTHTVIKVLIAQNLLKVFTQLTTIYVQFMLQKSRILNKRNIVFDHVK